MTQLLYRFEKIGGKWTCRLNADYFAKLYQETGLPIEITLDAYKKWGLVDVAMSKLEAWKEFRKTLPNKELEEINANWVNWKKYNAQIFV